MPIFACLGTDVTWTFSIQSSNFVIKFDIQFGTLALQHSKTLSWTIFDCCHYIPLLSLRKESVGRIIIFYRFSPWNYTLVSRDLFFLSFKWNKIIMGKFLASHSFTVIYPRKDIKQANNNLRMRLLNTLLYRDFPGSPVVQTPCFYCRV